ncbi:mannose-1-phosphate guanylyltransferase [Marivirga sp. S37H4]|uniref:mannose-1-phosphate guanylyltransferase n=1 Tax=Marivirga aurantiaca TaxID=2802615 RepID=A0A935CDK0_9BACT|nr:mannose-1-phosphate guanylyltransferase [Marivirga aurantiaca]MBK6266998.1 mannose-1-phosphate guanylyltransferase [Marivirga aurantiaca]
MNENKYVVIMAGGTGTRLWPVSTSQKPKQFHDLLGVGKSLLQMTYDRFATHFRKENIFIVTNKDYEGLVQEQIPDIGEDQLLLEPNKRNTAPCIAYAAYKIASRNPDAIMVVAPADHLILKEEVFHQAISIAVDSASKQDQLITLGMHPNRPETGYGYIQYIPDSAALKKVKTFTEKPELELAEKFIESGDFVWNAGIFIWSVKSIIASFEKFLPDLAEIFSDGDEPYYSANEKLFINKAYTQCMNISIDFAIMEKAENVYVLLMDIGWSDLGNWDSLHEIREKDIDNNVKPDNVLCFNATDNIVTLDQSKLVVIHGLQNYLVSEQNGVILICKKNAEKEIKEMVNSVKNQKGEGFI